MSARVTSIHSKDEKWHNQKDLLMEMDPSNFDEPHSMVYSLKKKIVRKSR